MTLGRQPRKARHYDWVAVYRMQQGMPVGRHPTWREIQEFLAWIDRKRITNEEAARLAGVDERMIPRWRNRVKELEPWLKKAA